MALYTPPSRRRRRLVLTGIAGLVVGAVAGLLIGRATVTTPADRIAEVRSEAEDIATRVQALTIEYEQALTGTGDTVQGGVLDALDGIDRDAHQTLDLAAWISPANRTEVEQALQKVRQEAQQQVPAEAFADDTAAAAGIIRDVLGGS